MGGNREFPPIIRSPILDSHMHHISINIPFCAGHRLLKHKGKCRHYHGHNYEALIILSSPQLDANDMVIDFSIIKTMIKEWIDEYWDHNMLLHQDDPFLDSLGLLEHGKNPYIMQDENDPTAEQMAYELYFKVRNMIDTRIPSNEIRLHKVQIQETPCCTASYS